MLGKGSKNIGVHYLIFSNINERVFPGVNLYEQNLALFSVFVAAYLFLSLHPDVFEPAVRDVMLACQEFVPSLLVPDTCKTGSGPDICSSTLQVITSRGSLDPVQECR